MRQAVVLDMDREAYSSKSYTDAFLGIIRDNSSSSVKFKFDGVNHFMLLSKNVVLINSVRRVLLRPVVFSASDMRLSVAR